MFPYVANPGMPPVDILKFSKWQILRQLDENYLPKTHIITPHTQLDALKQAMQDVGTPCIIKPDVGERGNGVKLISTFDELMEYIDTNSESVYLLQEFVDYPLEYGVMRYRMPGETTGTITGVVAKIPLSITGDGEQTLQELIISNERTAHYATTFKELHADKRDRVVPAGKEVQLTVIGNHCKGSKFLDKSQLICDEMVATFDRLADQVEGFNYGRFDVKVASEDDLISGDQLKVLEINGAQSEPAHIYDPNYPISKAYQQLFHHRKAMYMIAKKLNRDKGVSYRKFGTPVEHFFFTNNPTVTRATPTYTLADLARRIQQMIDNQRAAGIPVDLQQGVDLLHNYAGTDRKQYVTYSDETYTRNKVQLPTATKDFDIYIIGWEKEQGSAIHDHAENGCIYKTLTGQLEEQRYTRSATDELKLATSRSLPAGKAAYMSDSIGYHAMINPRSDTRAVSLHIYSPAGHQTTYFDEARHDELSLLNKTNNLIHDYLYDIKTNKQSTISYTPPEVLRNKLDLQLDTDGAPDSEIINICKTVLDKSVATQHKYFFNQLFAGADIYGIIAEWLTAVCNSSMYTYEMSPVFTLMETQLIEKMADLLGRDSEQTDGLMLPGGSMANLYAIHAARYRLTSSVKDHGIYQQQPYVIFTSDQSHYSISKSAMLLGIGQDQVVKIPTDTSGSMRVDKLESAIQQTKQANKQPLIINATAGTTVLGAFDNITALADLAQRYNIRLHVDGALGGAAVFSPAMRELLTGIEQVDSFTTNPHKMLGVPLQCTIFLLQDPDLLQSCNALHVDYLFSEDKAYDTSCDTGDKYIQCGRRVDALKFWLTWKARGQNGFARRVEHAHQLARYTYQQVRDHPSFLPYDQPPFNNLCLRYIPTALQEKVSSPEDLAPCASLIARITAKIKHRMMEDGTTMINYQSVKGHPSAFRWTFIRPELTRKDVDALIAHIADLGKQVEQELIPDTTAERLLTSEEHID